MKASKQASERANEYTSHPTFSFKWKVELVWLQHKSMPLNSKFVFVFVCVCVWQAMISPSAPCDGKESMLTVMMIVTMTMISFAYNLRYSCLCFSTKQLEYLHFHLQRKCWGMQNGQEFVCVYACILVRQLAGWCEGEYTCSWFICDRIQWLQCIAKRRRWCWWRVSIIIIIIRTAEIRKLIS